MFFSGTYKGGQNISKSQSMHLVDIGPVQGVWRYLDIIKVERAGGGRAQAELVLLLADLEPLRVAVHDEAGDASVSLSIKRQFAFTSVHYRGAHFSKVLKACVSAGCEHYESKTSTM